MSGADFVSHFTILYDDFRVAVYKDNNLWDFSKPDYLDVETLINVLPRLGYTVSHSYEALCDALDGEEPPQSIFDMRELLA